MGRQRTRDLGKLERLTEPLVRENDPLRSFGVFSCSKASNEMNYAAAKFTRGAMRTNNIDSCNRT